MSIVLTNKIKDVQLDLMECGLYPHSAGIDGRWGSASSKALQFLNEDYALRTLGNRLRAIPVMGRGNTPVDVVKTIQRVLISYKLYKGSTDGIWGPGTEEGWFKLVRSYRLYNKVTDLPPAWATKVKPAFYKRVEEWCQSKNLFRGAASALMTCMMFESGGTFSPTIKNAAGSNYYGLIQFGAAAAKDLGTTLDKLVKMSQMEQLEWVFKYFEMWMKRGKKPTQLEDFYLCILYPAAVGKNADQGVFFDGTVAYRQNRGLDTNKDGIVTVGEISKRIYELYYQGMAPHNRIS